MDTKITAGISLGVLMGAILATTFTVFADGDPTTDSVPRAIPYEGVLELNGQPIHAVGEDAIWVEFALYDGTESDTPVYIQRIALDVYAGRFAAAIGPVDDTGTPIEEVIRAADGLMLGMTLLGDDLDDPSDDVVMTNRQRILATPYALWTTSATNFAVASTLSVGGDVVMNGGALEGVGVINPSQPTRVGRALEVGGANLHLGVNDGLSQGSNTFQRALAHNSNDVLAINPDSDFEGGTRIDGDVTITGSINILEGTDNAGQVLHPNYHVTSTVKGSTIDLDMERIETLCGDGDGCTVRIGMLNWDNTGTGTAAASRQILFYYNAADRRWRSSTDNNGRIGDSSAFQHVTQIFDTCYLTDSEYRNFTHLGDDGQGLKLLLWRGFTGTNRSCVLTFVD